MTLTLQIQDKNNRPLYCKIILQRLSDETPSPAGDRPTCPPPAGDRPTCPPPAGDRPTCPSPAQTPPANPPVSICTEVIYCDGHYEKDIAQGWYDIRIHKGMLYKPFYRRIRAGTEDTAITAHLEEIIDRKAMNLYSFDGHSHISRDEDLATGDLPRASTIMRGEDFDFFFAGAPYDHKTHKEYLFGQWQAGESYRIRFAEIIARVRDYDFILDIGNEMVKCRYGHIFMINFSQKPPFSRYYDHAYDPWQFTKTGEEPPYEMPYIHEALRREKEENTVAVSAHPTSWWWHDNGAFITNIAATLGFDLLAGVIDALVIMGYQSDAVDYQAIWFEALNNGYFLPGVAETDAAFDTVPTDKLPYKTYTYADRFDTDALCRGIKRGRNIVSSGPLVTLRVNGCLPGDVMGYAEGDICQVEMAAFACREAQLCTVQLIVNGKVREEYPLCDGQFQKSVSISIAADTYIVAKCYDFAGNVAITNPVYIRNRPFVNINYKSHVQVTVTQDGVPAQGRFWQDEGAARPFSEEFSLNMNPASVLYVQVGTQVKTIRLIELRPLQEIFKNLYMGGFNQDKRYKPGQVPVEAFCLSAIRRLLDEVALRLDF